MELSAPAIVCAVRAHAETGAIVRLLTAQHGLIAGYVAGARGRDLRPVLIPGNLVEAELRSRSSTQLPSARIELVSSRGPWLTEPLPAAAIAWVTALTASVLPERNAYPALYDALGGLLDAICSAQAARQWVEALAVYEALMLRELGYGGERPAIANLGQALEILDRQEPLIARYLLADTRTDVLAARQLLRQRLARMVE